MALERQTYTGPSGQSLCDTHAPTSRRAAMVGTEALGASLGEAAMGADLGGSSKYLNENFKD